MSWVDALLRPRILRLLFSIVRSHLLTTRSEGQPSETDLPASEPQALAQARVPGSQEDARRTPGAESPSAQRPEAARRSGSEEVEHRERGRHRLPRGARVRRRSEIRALFRRGKRRRTVNLDVFVAASPTLRARLAVVVAKHGRKIVERNRLKRRLREAARVALLPRCRETGTTLDILICAKPSAYEATGTELKDQISELADHLCSGGS